MGEYAGSGIYCVATQVDCNIDTHGPRKLGCTAVAVIGEVHNLRDRSKQTRTHCITRAGVEIKGVDLKRLFVMPLQHLGDQVCNGVVTEIGRVIADPNLPGLSAPRYRA